ncbi:MAG: hypothetical protein KDN22_32885 [Verrucomicrobiae bacterium]|nr:hypothetical protein [Verrucomicrobiae bacterium]
MNHHFFKITLFSLATAATVVSTFISVPYVSAASEAALHVESSADRLTFHVDADEGAAAFWVLQQSLDGKSWQDLLFLDEGTAEVSWGSLRGSRSALFRAIGLEKDDTALREFLAARQQWRSGGFDRYRYDVRWNWSFFSWYGTLTVVDREVIASEKILSFPEEIGPLELLTIDGWFEKIAAARTNDAETIDVTWDSDFGFPASGFIDFSALIADEEQSWTIDSFSPLR